MTARAQAKLGLSSRAELTAFFAPAGLRAKLAEMAVRGERLLVGAYPLVDKRTVEKLTDAEREVVAYLVTGSTNSDIAHRRRTSKNTVANQVHSIYLKLGARSRAELAARLHKG
jgi:DNA-binding NarL/FixJ family response regulator